MAVPSGKFQFWQQDDRALAGYHFRTLEGGGEGEGKSRGREEKARTDSSEDHLPEETAPEQPISDGAWEAGKPVSRVGMMRVPLKHSVHRP